MTMRFDIVTTDCADRVRALEAALEHVTTEIEGQVRAGTLRTAGYETRVYWSQVARVGRDALRGVTRA